MMSPQAGKTRRRLLIIGIVALTAASALVANGLVNRARSQQELQQWTNAQAIPTVALAQITHSDAGQSLILPGNIQPYNKAAIYARVNGYLKSWNKDIGAQVKAGDVLATIDAPDLDQQFAQAKATLASAKANYDIAAITANRYGILVKKQAISQQLADQASADEAAKKAIMDADEANVNQLEAMEDYKNIVDLRYAAISRPQIRCDPGHHVQCD